MWKKIEAVIRPYKIQAIIEKLEPFGLFFYLEECKGFGKRLSPLSLYKAKKVPDLETLPRTKLTILVPENLLEKVIEIIVNQGDTGIVGDGKIFILPLYRVIDIYSKEIYGSY